VDYELVFIIIIFNGLNDYLTVLYLFVCRLCAETVDNFDPEINRGHVLECLKRLLVLYSNSEVCSCHMGEFLAFYLLCNLGSEDVLLLALELKQRVT